MGVHPQVFVKSGANATATVGIPDWGFTAQLSQEQPGINLRGQAAGFHGSQRIQATPTSTVAGRSGPRRASESGGAVNQFWAFCPHSQWWFWSFHRHDHL
jgi:hypothetical protein